MRTSMESFPFGIYCPRMCWEGTTERTTVETFLFDCIYIHTSTVPPFIAGPGPFPGLIDLYGSGGGLVEYRASLLASRGFVTLALAYMAFEDLPAMPEILELDYFEEAVNFLRKQQQVRDKLWCSSCWKLFSSFLMWNTIRHWMQVSFWDVRRRQHCLKDSMIWEMEKHGPQLQFCK